MKLIPKGSNKLVKVGKSIEITNKLITEINRREVAISDEFRVPIPDVNFQRVLSEEYYIEVVDGTVAYGDVKGLESLLCKKQDIESLDGVEYFISLKSLFCNNNQLTSLDVSENTALKRLWCSNNQLIDLDVSENTALNWLDCRFNQLTNLDLSNNLELKLFQGIGNPGTWWEELEKNE